MKLERLQSQDIAEAIVYAVVSRYTTLATPQSKTTPSAEMPVSSGSVSPTLDVQTGQTPRMPQSDPTS
jgi:hypothetical protein